MLPRGNTETSREALGLEALRRRGFEASFTADGDRLRVSGSERRFAPEAVPIVDHCRFEGTSDPDDSAVIYALEAPDGTRGVLVDAYGAYADPAVGALLDRMPVTRRRRDTRQPKLVARLLAIAAGCTAMALVGLVVLRRRGANVARGPRIARRPNLAGRRR